MEDFIFNNLIYAVLIALLVFFVYSFDYAMRYSNF